VEVALADEHGAGGAQARHDRASRAASTPARTARGGRGGHTLEVDEILKRDWNPVQRTTVAAGRDLAVGHVRLLARERGRHGDEGVERRIPSVDLRQARLRQVARRQSPVT